MSLVLDLLADGVTPPQIIADYYPGITMEDFQACMAYGFAPGADVPAGILRGAVNL